MKNKVKQNSCFRMDLLDKNVMVTEVLNICLIIHMEREKMISETVNFGYFIKMIMTARAGYMPKLFLACHFIILESLVIIWDMPPPQS